MISKKSFDTLKPGDTVLFKSGISREIIDVTKAYKRVKDPPRTYLTFKKIKGKGNTLRNWWDIKDKIQTVIIRII